MQSEKFDQLVYELTLLAENNPQAYRLRVFALAVLGYAYIGLILLSILIATMLLIMVLIQNHLSFVAFKFLVITGGLLFIIVKALWIRLPEPQGRVLTREQVPPLFEILDDIQQRLKAPKIHTVLLTNDLNAAIVQLPRLGIFGWQKNYLLVGMPLLQALSVEQFTAVLAHEYGHLTRAHGRWGAWIYRLRQTWQRLIDALQANKNWGGSLFYRFFNWYVPFFNAYSFVLARQEEYEADHYSSEINGSHYAAQALVSTEIKGRFLQERFWKKLYQLADTTEEPLQQPYRLLHKILSSTYAKSLTPEEKQQWMKELLSHNTSAHDTHPSLVDRLTALGETAQFPEPIKINAATHCFGEYLLEVLEELDKKWKENITPQWLARFNYVQQSKEILKTLLEKSQTETLTISECWQRAELAREFYGSEKALPFYRLILRKEPQHAAANFAVGTILSEKQHSRAPIFLKKSMEYNANFTIIACEQLHYFYQQQGDVETARFYLERARARAQEEQLAAIERSQLNNKDKFEEHQLDQTIINDLLEQLKTDKTIKRLHLVQKTLQHFPDKPLYILGITRTIGLRLQSNAEYIQKLTKIINLPIEMLIFVMDDHATLRRKLKKIPYALIYQKHIPWWAKWWIWSLFLLGILVTLFLLRVPEEIPVASSPKQIKQVFIPPPISQGNLLTLAQQQTQFKLSHVLSYDKRFVEGLKLAFETYPSLLAEMPTPLVEVTSQQLDEERFEIYYQIIFPQRKPINYQLILSNQPEQILNNFQAILTTFAQFKTIFQPRHFPYIVSEPTQKQLSTELLRFDTFEYLKQLQFINEQIINRKESPLILLSASEMFSWLSFFNNHQRDTLLADKLATQSLVYLLMGNHLSADSLYQQGLLLLALDYPNGALSLFAKKNNHLLAQLLNAFIRNDIEFMQKISEEKADYHQISWYLIMRAYQNMQVAGWTNFFMQRIVEKYPTFLAGKNYITAQGKVELTRVLTYPYLAEIFLQHLKIAEHFFNINLSEKKQDLIRNPRYKIETDDWATFYRQLLDQNTQLKNPQQTLVNTQLLKELLTKEVLNILVIAYELAADQLLDLGRAENVLTAIETIFANNPIFEALQLRQKLKREQFIEIKQLAIDEKHSFLLRTILSVYIRSAHDPQQRSTIMQLLQNYRQLQPPNARGYAQLAKVYEQFYYLPIAQLYLKNAVKLDPFQNTYQISFSEPKNELPTNIAIQELAYSLNEMQDTPLTPEQRCAQNLYFAIEKSKQNQINTAIEYLLMSIETQAVQQPEYDVALQWLKQLRDSTQQPIKK